MFSPPCSFSLNYNSLFRRGGHDSNVVPCRLHSSCRDFTAVTIHKRLHNRKAKTAFSYFINSFLKRLLCRNVPRFFLISLSSIPIPVKISTIALHGHAFTRISPLSVRVVRVLCDVRKIWTNGHSRQTLKSSYRIHSANVLFLLSLIRGLNSQRFG